ncbi:MAG TPA: YhjD/YihY/BrkB family envelope integrity protein [Pseudonocardia sp.]|nr:YhjD/YihY/BrkB family envelope integrity protein [Pseudonocardia sp.]
MPDPLLPHAHRRSVPGCAESESIRADPNGPGDVRVGRVVLRVRGWRRRFGRELGASFPAGDFALWAAGVTFFGVLGVVPMALVSLWLAAALVGEDQLVSSMHIAISGLPGGHGTPEAMRVLTDTAIRLSGWQVLVALFPASMYGEGLRRAFRQLSPAVEERFIGWRGRFGLLPVVAVGPALVLLLLAAAPVVAPLYRSGGGSLALGVVIAFHVVWVAISTALVLIYRWVGGRRARLGPLAGAGFTAGAFLSGFLQGFVLFLAIPVEWSLPFGGLPIFGAVVALALWLYALHLIVLLGYRLLLVLDR